MEWLQATCRLWLPVNNMYNLDQVVSQLTSCKQWMQRCAPLLQPPENGPVAAPRQQSFWCSCDNPNPATAGGPLQLPGSLPHLNAHKPIQLNPLCKIATSSSPTCSRSSAAAWESARGMAPARACSAAMGVAEKLATWRHTAGHSSSRRDSAWQRCPAAACSSSSGLRPAAVTG